MTEIVYVYCWNADRRQATVALSDGTNYWTEVSSVDDLWTSCANSGSGTRRQFEADIAGQAITIIEDGDCRCTSASL